MNKFAIIAIALCLLLVPGSHQDALLDQVLKLDYNPTYDLWFFSPDGRPDVVSMKVQTAYEHAKNSGGVCYYKEWFYCKTGEFIE
ncbi:uncharacterized protein Dwil_GK27058 [Drosophila willistoni]|uniref:Uncharacterized protein n=1 Tax=Drosophila willistoni TaxID=7260 RepID=A0A0Q9X4K2_DROWI|nr:uncharacterized protein Dwil_GK27058 [Drosophila willistoni]